MAGHLVQTPGDDATPRALDDEEPLVVERSKNSTSGACGQLRNLQKNKGLVGKMSEFPCETAHQQPKHPLCMLLEFTRREQDAGSTSGSEHRLHVEIV